MTGRLRISLTHSAGLSLILGLSALGCNSVTNLDSYQVGSDTTGEPAASCDTNAACTETATAKAGGTLTPSVCVKSSGRCEKLLSEDCDTVTGDYLDDRAIIIGSLFSTKGAQAATNIQRQQSAMLAVSQINKVNGVPGPDGDRPLVMVSCDETTDLRRAGSHLVDDLDVPAIVGPNTSQDTLDLSSDITIPGGVVVMSPTAVASSVASLIDNDMTWLMVPTDVQRAPLMLSQINAMERQLKTERGVDTIKLGIVYRDDALGIGTRTSLNDLTLNGKRMSDPINVGNHVRISPYKFTDANQDPITDEYTTTFLPDIIVLAGTAEGITAVMNPIEEKWPANKPRPHYIMIDSVKVTDLIMSATSHDELRQRVRGTGVTPSPISGPVYDAFKLDYQVAYPGSSIVSGMGPAYDATFAIAFALAATQNQPVSGASVAEGLRKLADGPTAIQIGATRVLQAFQKLAAGEKITATGTFSTLAWSTDGAVVGGTLEMWCIGAPGGKPTFQSSGLTFDIMTQTESGTYTPCGP
jgi:ABC-type branched-subunit amino acid transport system substrate-binding protein